MGLVGDPRVGLPALHRKLVSTSTQRVRNPLDGLYRGAVLPPVSAHLLGCRQF